MRTSLASCILAVVVAGAGPALAQTSPPVSFPAFATSEAQQRAQSGFPPVEDKVFGERYEVRRSYFDPSAKRYVWLLKPRSGAVVAGIEYEAEFQGLTPDGQERVSLRIGRLREDGTVEIVLADLPDGARMKDVSRVLVRERASTRAP